jgi:hypothetical protein
MRTSFHCIVFLFQLWSGAILLACGTAERIPRRDIPRWEVTHQILQTPISDLTVLGPLTMRADEHGGARFAGLNTVFGYNPDGSPSPTLGREGKGPGEFSGAWDLGFVGDSIWVSDINLDRLTFYDERNALARTVSPTGVGQWNPTTGVDVKSLNKGGIAFMVQYHSPPGLPGGSGWSALLKATSSQFGTASVLREAQQIDSVGGYRYILLKGHNQKGQLGLSLENPFADADVIAFAPNGSIAALVRRQVTNPSSPSFTVTVHGTTGLLRTDTIQSAHALVPITDSLIEAAWLKERPRMAHWIQEGFWPSEAAVRNAYLKALAAPSYLPPVAKVLVGNDSTVWLERPSPGTMAEWEVYDTKGRVLGQFKLPKSFTAVTASGNFIWGAEPDDEGQPRLARYCVTRR